MQSSRFCSAISGILFCSLALAGCDQGGGTGVTDEQEALPQIQVNLPPPPSFQKEHAAEKYADGSFSVYGLRKQLKANLENKVKVRGFIVEVYQCPECPKGKDCPCIKPHLWLADRAGGTKDNALMVVSIPKEKKRKQLKIDWKTGLAYYFTGVFSRNSEGGFSSADGLLVYEDSTPATGE